MGRKSYVSKAEEEADYEYQKYLEKKKQFQDEMSTMQKYHQAYLPVDGEPLSIYVTRINEIVHTTDLQLQKHYNWYVHKGSPNCPICDALNLNYYTLQILNFIIKEYPTVKLIAQKVKDGYGNLDWFFAKVGHKIKEKGIADV